MHRLHTTQKKKCCICGVEGKKEGFDLPAIMFNYLQGNPCICEKCIFIALNNFLNTHIDIDWKDCIKQHLQGEIK